MAVVAKGGVAVALTGAEEMLEGGPACLGRPRGSAARLRGRPEETASRPNCCVQTDLSAIGLGLYFGLCFVCGVEYPTRNVGSPPAEPR